MSEHKGLFWFRNDLRLEDNIALSELAKKCHKILPIYIFDLKDSIGSASMWWLEKSLISLNESLKQKKSKLLCFQGSPKKIILKLIEANNFSYIYWNRLYDPYSVKRDIIIKKNLLQKNIFCKSFKGSLINEPWEIKNKNGNFFKVFTPYWKNCLEEIKKNKLPKSPRNIFLPKKIILDNIFIKKIGSYSKENKWTKTLDQNWKPGEKNAKRIFKYFIKNDLINYNSLRDYPNKKNTSMLSPYLHFGEISPERIFQEIDNLKITKKNENLSRKKYLAEIGWREFSYNLLFNFTNIKSNPIQSKFLNFPWIKNNEHLNAWKRGKTGFPIVDAGMRQLYSLGWMHNRVRMITGSFLCKNLLIHWTEGEKWFFDTLVDADIASNSSGWQWIAGCGADAAPYFRIFNPILQSQRFDPDGKYIKKYLPELFNVPAEKIHEPWKLDDLDQKKYQCKIGINYPNPIVDIYKSRDRALDAYKNIKDIDEKK